MPFGTAQQHDLLLKYDRAGKGYCPEGFDYRTAYQKVAPLRKAIEDAFGGECFEQDPQNIQDMCVYAELGVPKHIATEKEWAPSLILSTFGDMVAVSGESALVAGALEKLISILDRQGFNYIAETVARAPYDGAIPHIKTWWQRYFDYL